MRRTTTAGTLAGLALILAACSPDGGDGEPSEAPTTEAARAEVSADPVETVAEPEEPEKSADAACSAVMETDLLMRIPDSIIAIGDSLGGEQLDELLAINDELGDAIDVAPPEIAAPLRSLQVPFQTVQDAVDGGGGELNIDTSDVAEDVTSLMEECVAAGYRVDQ